MINLKKNYLLCFGFIYVSSFFATTYKTTVYQLSPAVYWIPYMGAKFQFGKAIEALWPTNRVYFI